MICGKCKNYLSMMDLGVDWTAGKCTKRKIKVGSRTDATDCMDFDIKDYHKEPRVIKWKIKYF